ncbi:hypothetical protein CKO15_03480 [Halorhodospira abdelmalekii]|uniref:universal stress protein n=1 Tax=Halorhodospira abdelmalekii TaxID=421629 RepID=UPI0019041606|nr:universal stress protein [Halorhodospira abdelmalekii]MBK1734360.1 hypothetical protein [Halorhodospira abdelmalekii]
MINKILFASDLSQRAERAGYRAAQLAEQFDAELLAMHVIERDFPGLSSPFSAAPDPTALLSALAEQRLQESTPGRRAVPQVVVGDTVGELVRAADEQDGGVDLVVLGAHGQQHVKEWLLGTTTEHLVRHSTRPTLVVRGAGGERPYQRIAVAVDFSECSREALRCAVAWFPEAEFYVLHVLETEALDRMRAAGVSEDRVDQHYRELFNETQQTLTDFVAEAIDPTAELMHRFHLEVHAGHPATITRGALEGLQPDLVVLGNHGRGRWGNVLLGSLASRLLRELEQDILMVRD